MDPFDPLLDQPQTIDYHSLAPDIKFVVANEEIHIAADRDSNLQDLYWFWHGRTYASSIRVTISAPIRPQFELNSAPHDELTPLVTRFYPGHQETIYGSEGVIVSKRLFAPLHSHYDRAALWLLECQAEGDRLLRIQIDIDWGVPLDQRMVDGLLVAQVNPGNAQGLFSQQNAESTRVFGTSQGQPDYVEFPSAERARLVYHVLVMGQVDLPLILTLSDVGEQLAWNGFLALRNIGRVFEDSREAWNDLLRRGQVWTPHPPLNRAARFSKVATVQQIKRLRTGWAPGDRRTATIPDLIDSLDTFDVVRSQELLRRLSTLAQETQGRLPALFPSQLDEPATEPGLKLAETNGAFLDALSRHIGHHSAKQLTDEFYEAARMCAEVLVKARWQEFQNADQTIFRQASNGLQAATRLAEAIGDNANVARWESEAAEYSRLATSNPTDILSSSANSPERRLEAAIEEATVQGQLGQASADITANGLAVWQGIGVQWQAGELVVRPGWPQEWSWWALLDLPLADGSLSLLWDGIILYTTRQVSFDGATEVVKQIRLVDTSEYKFHPYFELTRTSAQGEDIVDERRFRPTFYTADTWAKGQPARGEWVEIP
jgi:hypothetical protein